MGNTSEPLQSCTGKCTSITTSQLFLHLSSFFFAFILAGCYFGGIFCLFLKPVRKAFPVINFKCRHLL